ncbi:MAG: hypothetical protein KatS3mg105_4834 [Gemmatales bacterium]|nr:MAG: hypothetical protein KatS3mg105_4834 [Gemmatales bacterium]
MSSRLGPIEIDCDAPPYAIVRACHMVGVRSAEDVRWWRLSEYLRQQIRWRDILRHPLKALKRVARGPGRCGCGEKLPSLEKCTFTRISGNKATYLIGQCPNCRTVYWDEPTAATVRPTRMSD